MPNFVEIGKKYVESMDGRVDTGFNRTTHWSLDADVLLRNYSLTHST